MKAVVTGSTGTIGSVLMTHLQAQGDTAIGWNRNEIPIDDYHAMEDFLRHEQPDVLFHTAVASQPTGRANETWFVNHEWTSEMAWITHVWDIRFIFLSTVMVFSDHAIGPFTIGSIADAQNGYGFEKRMAEARVAFQNPNAIVARLGWQIGTQDNANHMADHLTKVQRDHGQIDASERWYPACSFIEDTVQGLYQLAQGDHRGLYLLDSNEKWNYYEIVSALNEQQGNSWNVNRNTAFVYDQRMQDDRIQMASLKDRLPNLP